MSVITSNEETNKLYFYKDFFLTYSYQFDKKYYKDGNNGIVRQLRNIVIPNEVYSENHFIQVIFKTSGDAKAFLSRLNQYIEKKAEKFRIANKMLQEAIKY